VSALKLREFGLKQLPIAANVVPAGAQMFRLFIDHAVIKRGIPPSRLLRVEISAVSAAGENNKKQNDKCCE
jgi:hypothetical protein